MIDDSLIQKGLRTKLIERLRERGIKNEKVLEAMSKVPRHLFMDKSFISHAYEDKPFSISAGQTISQPYTVAFQTELLQIERFDKILEIGTGSGYQAAVLAELGAIVYTVERQRELFISAQRTLKRLSYSAKCFWSDGYEGKDAFAPFKKILITAGAPEVPEKLKLQLAIGGRLVAPIGKDNQQTMTLVCRISETEFETSAHGNFMFVPMLNGLVT
ncbi:MAG: protein-L-isoaspartate(D-aspartate) O-methyltransferase [Prevotellaceae bacterium]|jgi:protein-L-isoaspartate(D-aspartate) O-methyltransferase|nr:protein-L-isoaspartate(D-aspartate) O-methyltransferase [Prevotellaceae bacterium]